MKINYPDIKEISKRVALAVLLIAVGWYMKGRLSAGGDMSGYGPQETYVLAQQAERKNITLLNNKISYIEAINEVDILPKVTGTIEKVLFDEGSLVKEGDVLFEIDPSKYQAAFDLATAQLDSAKANLVKAERDYKRQVKLSSEKFASKATFDTSESAYLQAKAAVEEAKANLDVATIDLGNTKVVAPISGKIGKALVTKGNYVTVSSVTLAKIVQVNPIRVSYSVTDKEMAKIQKTKYKVEELTAHITLADGEEINEKVSNIFFGNAINASTATLPVYADVKNDENRLIPGNYVQSAMLSKEQIYSVVVPQSALNYDKDGAYIYVVTPNKEASKETDMHGIAEQRRIVLGDTVVGTDQEVVKGLSEGEIVVIQGTVKIQNNSPVKVGMVEKK